MLHIWFGNDVEGRGERVGWWADIITGRGTSQTSTLSLQLPQNRGKALPPQSCLMPPERIVDVDTIILSVTTDYALWRGDGQVCKSRLHYFIMVSIFNCNDYFCFACKQIYQIQKTVVGTKAHSLSQNSNVWCSLIPFKIWGNTKQTHRQTVTPSMGILARLTNSEWEMEVAATLFHTHFESKKCDGKRLLLAVIDTHAVLLFTL